MENLNSQDSLGISESFSPFSSSLPSTRPARILKPKPNMTCRRKREFISEEKKDASYWEKRRKNNEAAKRSREKRRLNDMVLENRVLALNEENVRLKTELLQLKLRFGLISTASYMEKSQQIGGNSVNHYFSSGYSSGSQVMVNSDSSEAEQSSRGDGNTPLAKYSPRGSLSDMSDGSSRDSPEPMTYEVKHESSSMDINTLEQENTQMMFHSLGSHHQEIDSVMDYHQEPASLPSANLAPQRSVILYRSSSSSYPVESQRTQEVEQQHTLASHVPQVGGNPTKPESSEPITEGTHQLKTLDSTYEFSTVEEQATYNIQQEHQQHRNHQLEDLGPDSYAPDLLNSNEESDLSSYHPSYLNSQDEEPPVLTYEGGPSSETYYQERSAKDSSSSDGDPRSSDKDASTDDESPFSSSCSEAGGYHRLSSHPVSPAHPYSTSQNPGEGQTEVKTTALPHKLRLKYRALSNGGNSQYDTSATMVCSPVLPQHPYLALTHVNQQTSNSSISARESQTPMGFCKPAPQDREQKEDGKKETERRVNSRNKRRD
uniref:Nuclear factor, interleukin 3 regulated, member 5 n=1 Tax=Lepisosteus oculatus TaxID=7918 RepID=W5NP41_LEPOC|nr:PREDICTED: nuclear factor interleukin-3-regulated protein-like [Lepisosteus oculatus]